MDAIVLPEAELVTNFTPKAKLRRAVMNRFEMDAMHPAALALGMVSTRAICGSHRTTCLVDG